ncbi:MAG TPA: MaoC/PaaZ C-terminal domain-containing protein [Streptosporangiaceae bacterium]|jgi:acyl dehydratase
MPLNHSVVGRTAGPATCGWTADDALLYALGVGAGQDDPADELPLTTENTAGVRQQILPTYAIVTTQRATGLAIDLGDFDRAGLVHAEQGLTLHRPLPVAGQVRLSSVVTGLADKGSGALVTVETTGCDPSTGTPMFTSVSAQFIRGEGGFGRAPGPAAAGWTLPGSAPDVQVIATTRPDQALLYRLCGDRNPLHSDPAFAARGGFPRPILHGLCTYGITARVLLRALGAAAEQLISINGRFTRPVFPGDRLMVSAWHRGAGSFLFRTVNGDGVVVLDRGELTISDTVPR